MWFYCILQNVFLWTGVLWTVHILFKALWCRNMNPEEKSNFRHTDELIKSRTSLNQIMTWTSFYDLHEYALLVSVWASGFAYYTHSSVPDTRCFLHLPSHCMRTLHMTFWIFTAALRVHKHFTIWTNLRHKYVKKHLYGNSSKKYGLL